MSVKKSGKKVEEEIEETVELPEEQTGVVSFDIEGFMNAVHRSKRKGSAPSEDTMMGTVLKIIRTESAKNATTPGMLMGDLLKAVKQAGYETYEQMVRNYTVQMMNRKEPLVKVCKLQGRLFVMSIERYNELNADPKVRAWLLKNDKFGA
jgi:hypothetical protein